MQINHKFQLLYAQFRIMGADSKASEQQLDQALMLLDGVEMALDRRRPSSLIAATQKTVSLVWRLLVSTFWLSRSVRPSEGLSGSWNREHLLGPLRPVNVISFAFGLTVLALSGYDGT
jgi:hypothetical protein